MKNHTLLALANILWGCSYPMAAMSMPHYITPLALLSFNILVAALLSITSLVWEQCRTCPREDGTSAILINRRDILWFAAAALLVAIVRKGLLLYGMSLTSAIDGSIISTLTPIIVLVISVVIGIERFSRLTLLGILLGLAGAIGVILAGGGDSSSSSLLGNVMVLICALCSAIYMIWFKSLLRRYDPVLVLRWMFTIAAILLLPFGYKSMMTVNFSAMPPHILFAVIYMIVVPTYLPNLMLQRALKGVTPTVSSIYVYLQPAIAVALSIALGLDHLTSQIVLFALLIFSGVGIVIAAGRR